MKRVIVSLAILAVIAPMLTFPLALGVDTVSAFPSVHGGDQGGVFWIANEGQWEGDFSFKCEVGSAVYYVTPKGMTVDFREYTRHERCFMSNRVRMWGRFRWSTSGWMRRCEWTREAI